MTQAQLSKLSELRIDPKQRGGARPGRRVLVTLGLSLLACGLVLVGLSGLGIAPDSARALMPWVRLAAAKVTTTRVVLRKEGGAVPGSGVLTANGYVVACQQAAVSARSTGLLESRLVDIGDRVSKGQELARIEHAREEVQLLSAKSRLVIAEANLAEEKTELAIAHKELERQERLRRQGIATEQALDDAEARASRSQAKVRALEAEIAAARTEVAAAEVELEYTFVRAPFDGTVLSKDAEVGEIVAPVSMGGVNARGSIVTVANLKDMEVEVDVSEAYISRIEPHLPAQVLLDAYPDRPYRGQVRQIVPAANRQKAAVQVKVKIFDPDERVLPEMGAKVTFLEEALPEPAGEAKSALRVDSRAVRRNASGPFLLVVRDGKVEARTVELGEVQGQEVELVRGAAEGEVVVLEGPEKLESGTSVQVQE
jgi:RND family efflux transporter MFP subunit